MLALEVVRRIPGPDPEDVVDALEELRPAVDVEVPEQLPVGGRPPGLIPNTKRPSRMLSSIATFVAIAAG